MSACPGSKHCALWQQRDGRFKRAQAGVIILLRNFCQPHSPGALQVRGAGSAHAVGSPTCPFPRTIMSQAALRGELAAVADVASNALTMVVTVSHGHVFRVHGQKGCFQISNAEKNVFLGFIVQTSSSSSALSCGLPGRNADPPALQELLAERTVLLRMHRQLCTRCPCVAPPRAHSPRRVSLLCFGRAIQRVFTFFITVYPYADAF